MLTEIYIEALLVDEELADQAWDAGEIDDETTCIAWMLIASLRSEHVGPAPKPPEDYYT